MRVKIACALSMLLMLDGCGYSSMHNQLVGQVKRVYDNTPLICPDYTDVDVSLGVIRNGVGSMSTQDIILYVPSQADADLLRKAQDNGALVRITYNTARFRLCVEEETVTHVEVLK